MGFPTRYCDADMMTTSPREHVSILAGDLRYCLRVLQKSPGFVCAALLAIILGVSATTTVFSLINAVLIRPLPYDSPERLVYMWAPAPNVGGIERETPPFYADIVSWQKTSHSFENITAMRRYIALLQGSSPQRLGGARVFGNFFETLGATAQLGRLIGKDDDQPGRQFVTVISDKLWRSRFGGAPDAVGKSLQIGRQRYRVVGVMRKEFSYPHGIDFPGQYELAWLPRTDLWVPAALTLKQQADPSFEGVDAVIGRLRPGIGLSQAQSEVSAIEKRLTPLHLEGWQGQQALLVPFVDTTIGPVRPLLHLLLGAVCLVLLMACGNFASLLMARAANSLHEVSIRMALGAQRSRLVRLALTESLLLSIGGGAIATLFSFATMRMVERINPHDIPRFEEAAIDLHVLLFGLFVSLATGLLSGIIPTLLGPFPDPGETLRKRGRTIAGGSWHARNVLLVGQIALSMVLLTGAGLLIRSYLAVLSQNKGFSQSTLTMSINLDDQTQNSDRIRRRLMDGIRSLPGVQFAGSIDDLPLSTSEDKGFLDVDGYVSKRMETVSVRETAGDYFRAMQIPLLSGRYLQDSDVQVLAPDAYPRLALVSESFAKRYFPGRNPVGHRLRINKSAWARIVGEVGDVRHTSLEEDPEPIVYYQNGLADSVAIRTTGPPASVIASIRNAVRLLAHGASVTDIRTMSSYVDEASARRRFQTTALTMFAGAAVLLTLVGLHGLLSFAVRQRTAEIGIRMAVGASSGAILKMIVGYGLRLSVIGIAIGTCLAFTLARAMTSFLYGVQAIDLETFVFVPSLILLVALIACIAPAWKAARIEPVRVLGQQ